MRGRRLSVRDDLHSPYPALRTPGRFRGVGSHHQLGERRISIVGVFGANGFIGRAIVRRLLAEGRRVVAFGRGFPPDYGLLVGTQVEIRTVDFANTLSVHAALQDIDEVIDLVNSSSPALANSRVVEDAATNVLTHISFIQSCIASDISRIIFLSSGGTVYGVPRYLPIDEEHPTNPLNSYGLTKLMVEQYLQLLTRGTATSYVVLRVSNPFGPGQIMRKGQGLIASVLERHAAGLPVVVHGDGQIWRDYIYIDDLCDAIVLALNSDCPSQVLNIGTGEGRSIIDVVSQIEAALGERLQTQFAPARSTDVKNNVLECAKAFQTIGWKAKTSFSEGIRRTVASAVTGAGGAD